MDALTRYAWVVATVGIFLLAAGGSSALFYQDFDVYAKVSLGCGALLILAYAWLDRDQLQRGIATRSFQLGLGSGVIVLLAGAVAGTLMVIAKRHDHQFDVTRDARHTLSDQGKQVLGALEEDVDVVAFFSANAPSRAAFSELMDQSRAASAKLRVQLVDPVEEPLLAEQYAVTTDQGTVVLVKGESRQRLEARFDEGAFIDAVIRLQSGREHVVCWSTGHDEADPDGDAARGGYGAIVRKLEDTGYKVVKKSLLGGVPPDCEIVVVAGARQDLLPSEREAFAAFVAGGGRAMVMLEPFVADAWSVELVRYGVEVGNDVVVEANPDAMMAGFDASYLVVSDDQFSPDSLITKNLRSIAVFGGARGLKASADSQGLQVHEIVRSSDAAWAETDLSPDGGGVEMTDGKDRPGPIGIVITVDVEDPAVLHVLAPLPADGAPVAPAATLADPAVEGAPAAPMLQVGGAAPDLDARRGVPAGFVPKKGGRLVVFGDSDFGSDALLSLGNNQDLVLNSVAWLADETSQIAERPAKDGERLTPTLLGQLFHMAMAMCCIPAGTLMVAGIVLIRRRFL